MVLVGGRGWLGGAAAAAAAWPRLNAADCAAAWANTQS